MVSYGAVVWLPKTKQSTVESKLQRLQRLACMAMTTPTAALEVMLGLPPLHLFIQQEATLSAFRLSSLKLWNQSLVPHAELITATTLETPLFGAACNKVPVEYIFDKKYKIQLFEEGIESLNPRELRVFTDGSKTRSGTGSGIFSEDLNINISTPLGEHSTVFHGITQAAQAITTRKVRGQPIRILSDSMSVLQALEGHKFSSGLIIECHNTLTEIGNHNTLTLQWIKGHSNSSGNDLFYSRLISFTLPVTKTL